MTEDQYDASFARSFSQRFQQLGGAVSERVVPANRQTYSDLLPEIQGASDVLLAVQAGAAARIVNEQSALGRLPRWYLTPALRTEVFVQNASPQALAGAEGVSPEVNLDPAFVAAFQRYWHGDLPLESSAFYYDAVALFALGYERAAQKYGTAPQGAQLTEGDLRRRVQQRDHHPLVRSRARRRGGARSDGPVLQRPHRVDRVSPDGQRGFGRSELWRVSPGGAIEGVP